MDTIGAPTVLLLMVKVPRLVSMVFNLIRGKSIEVSLKRLKSLKQWRESPKLPLPAQIKIAFALELLSRKPSPSKIKG
jgi:hypothetical protein